MIIQLFGLTENKCFQISTVTIVWVDVVWHHVQQALYHTGP